MKVLVADDHELIIDGFVTVIENYDASIECYRATNKFELFETLESVSVDMLFQDVMFGKNDARSFVKEIKEKYPELKIIIISTLEDNNTVETLLKQGVDGYLAKSDSSNEIISALTAVSEGKTFISNNLKKQGTTSLRKNTIILTPREKEVLSLILQEKTTKEIADKVCLSEKTVENHRANLFVKFGVKNLAGLVKQAILEGFL